MVNAKIGKWGIVLIAPISIPGSTGSSPVLTTKCCSRERGINIKSIKLIYYNTEEFLTSKNVLFPIRYANRYKMRGTKN